MNYLNKSIRKIHTALVNKEVSCVELVREALRKIQADKCNAFELVLEEEALKEAAFLDTLGIEEDNLFYGIPYVCKDNISTKGIITTGGSEILKDYIPLYDAKVIEILKSKKAILVAKTTLDELAMGGTGLSNHLGVQKNPLDHTRIIGGSSSGSAIATLEGVTPFALGSDTGDSVRKPASYGGIVGYKGTYGSISRYGLFSFCPSLDHIGFFTRNVEDSALVFDLLNQIDELDLTSSRRERIKTFPLLNKSLKGKKVCLIKEINESFKDSIAYPDYLKSIEDLKKEGVVFEEVSISSALLQALYPAYIVISSSEATSNNACLDGIKYGMRVKGSSYEEIISETRTQGFGELIKRRFILGAYALRSEEQNNTYLRAKRVRRLIVEEIEKIFKDYDYLYTLASRIRAPKIDKKTDNLDVSKLIADNILALGNFGGYPSITIPLAFYDHLPIGVNITGRAFEDGEVFALASLLEKLIGIKDFSVEEES
ncbi:MAG TPA: amidase family protein [Candidatus Onthovivens sp.]|nr:amidase family protein [Candidatus Onthovivens sp.]